MPQNNANNTKQLEHNKKWRSYLLICVTSLTNFVSINEATKKQLPYYFHGGNLKVNHIFGAFTFTTSLLILIFDVIKIMKNKINFESLKEGKVEGWTLFLFLIWWICGVVSITRAGSIGYAALNVYFSTWASFFACVRALDLWGGEKDILTLKQLTRISITLPYWWILFWASIILFGSAADAIMLVTTPDVSFSCAVAMLVGIMTSMISAFFILSHYEFFHCCLACSVWLTYGGWFELACSILANILLVIGLEQLTGAGRIGSTITGNASSDPSSEEYVPGSNIYVAIWVSFIASAMVTVKWKEASAIRFAQTAGDDRVGEEGGDDEDEEAGVEDGGERGGGGEVGM